MKAGYSLLVDEHLDTVFLDYRDGEYFQLVCAVCPEPVFKGYVRNAHGILAEAKHP